MSSVVFVLKLLGKSSHLKIISTARREREDASHLLVDEHVGFGAFDVSVRDPLHVVVRAKKPSRSVNFGGAGGRAFPEGDKVTTGVVHAQMRDDGDQMVNVVARSEKPIFGIAQDRRGRSTGERRSSLLRPPARETVESDSASVLVVEIHEHGETARLDTRFGRRGRRLRGRVTVGEWAALNSREGKTSSVFGHGAVGGDMIKTTAAAS